MALTPDGPSGTPTHEGYVVDAENAAEMARLMLQDHLLTKAMGGPLAEQNDLAHIYRVLDIGCGPGGWLLDVVAQHPQIQAVGIDISQLMIAYANNLATSTGVPQVQFRVMDATRPLDFPDNTFDLVNGRILSGFLTTQQWPTLLKECARVTKPGGILRLTEAEWAFTNSPALDQYMGWETQAAYRASHSFSPHGRTMGTTPVLRLLLRQAGYETIESRAYVVDYSAGAPYHESNVQNFLVFFKLFQPFLVQMQVATQAELDQCYDQMQEEMQGDDFCGIDYFLTVWGHKARR
jgi:ubiquinone/menaquinone biosynthesis C-methylase UbiE